MIIDCVTYSMIGADVAGVCVYVVGSRQNGFYHAYLYVRSTDKRADKRAVVYPKHVEFFIKH